MTEDAEQTVDETAGTDAESEATSLADRVAEYDEDLAGDVAALEDDVEGLRSEVESLEGEIESLEAEVESAEEEYETVRDRLQRTQADFQNYKKRAKQREEDIKERATEDLVERLVDVRDNLQRALDAEGDIREGVEATLREFDRVLEDENVVAIEPEPGDEVDPMRHAVMMRVAADQPAGTVAEVYRPGYEMGGSVIQEAQVTVSEGPDEE